MADHPGWRERLAALADQGEEGLNFRSIVREIYAGAPNYRQAWIADLRTALAASPSPQEGRGGAEVQPCDHATLEEAVACEDTLAHMAAWDRAGRGAAQADETMPPERREVMDAVADAVAEWLGTRGGRVVLMRDDEGRHRGEGVLAVDAHVLRAIALDSPDGQGDDVLHVFVAAQHPVEALVDVIESALPCPNDYGALGSRQVAFDVVAALAPLLGTPGDAE